MHESEMCLKQNKNANGKTQSRDCVPDRTNPSLKRQENRSCGLKLLCTHGKLWRLGGEGSTLNKKKSTARLKITKFVHYENYRITVKKT